EGGCARACAVTEPGQGVGVVTGGGRRRRAACPSRGSSPDQAGHAIAVWNPGAGGRSPRAGAGARGRGALGMRRTGSGGGSYPTTVRTAPTGAAACRGSPAVMGRILLTSKSLAQVLEAHVTLSGDPPAVRDGTVTSA